MGQAQRPNILLVVVHDLGTHLACHGHATVASPYLDALAQEGVCFRRHFATACFCSPSRGALITGRHPHVNGLMGLVNLDWDLPQHNATLASMLGEHGYETYLFGLQHEAGDARGLGFQHLPNRSVGTECHAVANQVAEFMRGRGSGTDPFYARVGFFEVHRPHERYEAADPATVEVPAFMRDTPSAREDLAMFHGSIRTMDAAVGTILAALDEAGLRDETLVIFTTDHGIAFPRAKSTLYDPGLHTTLLMRWPNGFGGGRVCDELLSNADLVPTILEATGAPSRGDLTGHSFWDLLSDGEYAPNTSVFAEKNTHPDDIKRCIRTGGFKYIRNYDEGPLLRLPTDIEMSLTRRDMGNAHLAPRPEVELYNLESDPLEATNLAGRAEYADVERELATQLGTFQEATSDPILRGPIERPPGEAEIIRGLRERVARQKREQGREGDEW